MIRGVRVRMIAAVVVLSACAADVTPTVSPRVAFPSAVVVSTPLPSLALPQVGTGSVCPTTKWQLVGELRAPASFGGAMAYQVPSDGPVYPLFDSLDVRTATVPLASFGTHVEERYAPYKWLKVRWIVSPATSGSVVVRGARLDAPGPMRFEGERSDRLEIRDDNTASNAGWRYLVPRGSISVDGPGCYGLQIDGDGWRRHVIFQVAP